MTIEDIILIKNRSDIGAGTRGSDMGIDAMEIAAINQQSDFFHQVQHIDVATNNDSVYLKNHFPFAKRIEYVWLQCERVADAVYTSLRSNKFPIVLSGDHSSALGTISGIKKMFPLKRLGVIWLDAHADIHSPYTSPSGNVHGMPLAAALGMDNLNFKIRDLSEEVVGYWEKLKNIGTNDVKIKAGDLIYFGLRDFEKEEFEIIQKEKIHYFTVDQIREDGISYCCDQALAQLAACDLLYISFDVDSMDAQLVSEGTGTPVAKGFTPEEIEAMILHLYTSQKVVCTEFTEINPLLDKQGNKMAETAFDILEKISNVSKLPV